QPVGAVDLDRDVLTPGREDLVVDQRVPRVRRQRLLGQVVRGERAQDPDHDHVYADRGGAVLGHVEAVADVRLEVGQPGTAEFPRRHIDLDVALAQLGDEGRVGGHLQYARVAHHRIAGGIDQVQLDLQAGHR